MTSLRKRMLEDLRIRNYSPSTVRCYVRSVAEFARYFNKSPEDLGEEEIRTWQLYLLNEKRVKQATYIQAVCALRFLYRSTLHRKIDFDRIPLPRYEKKLPVILSKEEVKALLLSNIACDCRGENPRVDVDTAMGLFFQDGCVKDLHIPPPNAGGRRIPLAFDHVLLAVLLSDGVQSAVV